MAGHGTSLPSVSIAGCPADPSIRGWGELSGCRDPWEPLCSQQGHGDTMKPAPPSQDTSLGLACETAVFWGDTVRGLAIGRKR